MVNINKIIDEYLLEQPGTWSGLDVQGILDLAGRVDTGDGGDGGDGDGGQSEDWRVTMGNAMNKHLEITRDKPTQEPTLPDLGGYGVDTGTYIQNNLGLKLPEQIRKPDGTLVPRWTAGDPYIIRTCPTCPPAAAADVEGAAEADTPKFPDVEIK
jgi:hypothetical protein